VTNRFAHCPDTPNCVSSYAMDDRHRVDPLPLPSTGRPLAVIRSIVETMPRTAVVTQDDEYLHATFTSLVFRFVDDVEFHVSRDAAVIHVRSASRVGRGDLGVNRRRVERFRSRLTALEARGGGATS
jgi:uncharacterized protein (DUF1499 family)